MVPPPGQPPARFGLGARGVTVLAGARDQARGLAAERVLQADVRDGASARFVRLDVTDAASVRQVADWIGHPSGLLWGHLWTADGPAGAYGPLPW